MTEAVPDPPDRLPSLRDEHVVTIGAGALLMRAHRLAGPHPCGHDQLRTFGPLAGKGRFDHHPAGEPVDHAPTHGVAYVALNDPREPLPSTPVPGNALNVVLAELVQRGHELVIEPGLTLTVSELQDSLQLLDVRGTWAQQTRAGTHLSTAPHEKVQPWARRIRAAYPDLAGILYTPSTGGYAVAAALNENARSALASATMQISREFRDPHLLPVIEAAAAHLDIAITHASG